VRFARSNVDNLLKKQGFANSIIFCKLPAVANAPSQDFSIFQTLDEWSITGALIG
jgi:hypothetical protein